MRKSMEDDWSAFGDDRKTKKEWYNYFVESIEYNCQIYYGQFLSSIPEEDKLNYKNHLIQELNIQFDKINSVGSYVIKHRIATTTTNKERLLFENYNMSIHNTTITVIEDEKI